MKVNMAKNKQRPHKRKSGYLIGQYIPTDGRTDRHSIVTLVSFFAWSRGIIKSFNAYLCSVFFSVHRILILKKINYFILGKFMFLKIFFQTILK